MASSKGIPCGGSFISASKKCRLNEYGLQGVESFVSKELLSKVREELDSFEDHLSDYNGPAQEFFRSLLKKRLKETVSVLNDPGKAKNHNFQEKHLLRVAQGARVLAQDGPPSRLLSKDGTEMKVSAYIRPTLSRKGNMGWEDPIVGMTFTKRKQGQMTLELNRVLASYDMVQGRLQAFQTYRARWERLVKDKPFGGTEAARIREVPESEVTQFLAKLTPSQRRDMSTCGIDLGGDSRVKRNEDNPTAAGNRARFTSVLTSPEYLKQRERDIAKAYLRQTPGPGQLAISPWTGLPVSPPGIMLKGGYPSTLDHARPLSDLYDRLPKGRKATDAEVLSLLRERDVSDNFVVGERGINAVKGDRDDWNEISGSFDKLQMKYERNLRNAESNPQFGKGNEFTPTVAETIRQTKTIPEVPARNRKLSPEDRAEAIAFLKELQTQ